MATRYPAPLQPGDKIAVTAPSSGITPAHYPRLELVLGHLRSQGFVVVEGECLRAREKHVSGPREKRAAELMRFWCDPSIKAIMPPWGGEFLIDILPLLDFEKMAKAGPKWTAGYSDISTLHFALTLRTGIATLHSSTLMDLTPAETDPLTNGVVPTMRLREGESFTQHSSAKYQKDWQDFVTHVETPLNLTEPTQWKTLLPSMGEQGAIAGRLIGGCIDTIARLVGTPYGDLAAFKARHRAEGTLFYFENCEMSPCDLTRTLWNLRLAGWFEGLNGILIGRSAGPDTTDPANLSYVESLQAVLGDLGIPILYDLDIGHKPPNLNILNGSLGEVSWNKGQGTLTQTLLP